MRADTELDDSPRSPRPRPLHAERTADAATLRWVVHHPGIKASVSAGRTPDDGPLGRLVAQGEIRSVAVDHGDLLITTDDPHAWPTIGEPVRRAVEQELDRLDEGSTTWLLDATGPTRCPDVREVQQIIDRAAGPLLSLHGGSVHVVDVEPDLVTISMTGACSGCGGVSSTLHGIIAPAIRATFPDLAVTLAPDPLVECDPRAATGAPADAAISVKRPSGIVNRLRRSGSCH